MDDAEDQRTDQPGTRNEGQIRRFPSTLSITTFIEPSMFQLDTDFRQP